MLSCESCTGMEQWNDVIIPSKPKRVSHQECDYVVRGSCSPPRVIQQNDSNKHSPKPTQPWQVTVQWVRDMCSSVPVRGSTRPSIPPSLYRLEEVYPKAESQRPWIFFFSTCAHRVPSGSADSKTTWWCKPRVSHPLFWSLPDPVLVLLVDVFTRCLPVS